jgi:predicted esterase
MLFYFSSMQKVSIAVRKTARYFMLGEPGSDVRDIWFVCHGYGQLAADFLTCFTDLQAPGTLVIAPEGLHRFYWEKFSGKVVASWMTKEDREDDINDYVAFLSAVLNEVKGECSGQVRLHVLGFSQGSATVCRWIDRSALKITSLIVWAGDVPEDLSSNFFQSLTDARSFLVVGTNDEFINEERLQKQVEILASRNFNPELIRFDGRHRIHTETLQRISGILKKSF